MASASKVPSESAKSSSGSPADREGLHIEIDRDKLEPLTRPGITGHHWVQRGPYLVCTSCPIEHALWIGVDKMLVGYNKKGEPLLKKINGSDSGSHSR